MVITECLICGKTIQRPDHKKRYCSVECRREAEKRKRWEKIGTKTIKCEICGKEIVVTKNANRKTCSRECFKKHWRKYNTEYVANRRKIEPDYGKMSTEQAKYWEHRKIWKKYLTYSDEILQLIDKGIEKEILAVYLEEKFRCRRKELRQDSWSQEEKDYYKKLKDYQND